jgi:hypothetical protein
MEYNKRNSFRGELQKILILPIYKAIRESNEPLTYHIEQMNIKGFKITYKGLTNSIRGINWSAYQFDYYFRLYEYFNINIDVNSFAQLLIDSIEYNKQFRELKSNDKRFKKIA